MPTFEIGKEYKRTELHAEHGGQRQGGISTPAGKSFLMLFTGKGSRHGYSDNWHEGVFRYFGEGQYGDMTFVAGNKAIRDSAANGRDLHLFENIGKGFVRYLGNFTCCSWEWAESPDTDGNLRKAIAFHLVPLEQLEEPAPISTTKATVDTLRAQALAGATPAGPAKFREARHIAYERSNAVRQYVLARAAGRCEACRKSAPFTRHNGEPYLEPHHTRRLSDGGPDHPRWVGGICPNCHREIHYGKEGSTLNEMLQRYLETNF
jgi:5-methylcytosine-specific restriction protein A